MSVVQLNGSQILLLPEGTLQISRDKGVNWFNMRVSDKKLFTAARILWEAEICMAGIKTQAGVIALAYQHQPCRKKKQYREVTG